MIDRLSRSAFFHADDSASGDSGAASRRANRRRAFVFGGVFVVLALAGLVWDFARPAVYEATSLLNFVPAPMVAAGPEDATRAGDKPYQVRDEIQVLTSTTLLRTVWNDLKDEPAAPRGPVDGDMPTRLQAMLSARQVTGTNVVSVQARGADPAFLATFVNRVVDDYQASLGQRFQSGSTTAIAEAEDETNKLDAAMTEKRLALDAFRARYNIVSAERDENQVLSEVKGTATSLNAANEKLAAAEAKLAALKDAAASGQSVVRARDNPTLAALEQQASAIRGELRETARTFTQEYMAIDPRIRALRARLTEIEEQIVTQRSAGQQSALSEAQQDVAAARAAAATLRQQLSSNQSTVQGFTSRFNEYKARQDELTHLELLRQKANDRLATLQAGERGRKPKIEVIETASPPQSPASPSYARDAFIVVIGALFVALLTMGIVELFNQAPERPTTVIVPQPFTTVGLVDRPVALPSSAGRAALLDGGVRSIDDEPPARLAAPSTLPRELTDDEQAALLAAADPSLRVAIGLLLSGVAPREATTLREADVRRDAAMIDVPGDDHRTIALPPTVTAWLDATDARSRAVDAPLMTTPGGRPMSDADVATALLYAAHDAGIEDADAITPEALRHTYLAYLLRQGMRFSELARIAGPLPADRLTAYKRLVPGGRTATPIDPVLPALRAPS